VLTFRCARTALASWSAARIGGAVALSIVTWTSAGADGIAAGGCIGAAATLNCAVRWGSPGDPFVRLVPQTFDEAAKAAATERDRKWMDRCRPVITQDRYGVPRYHYSAAGCEFGVIK
jgi:hypothetical protein